MKICVVGTGTMGNGIAQTFAQAGHDVLLKGRSEASLGKAHKAIEKSLSKLVEKGKMEAAEKKYKDLGGITGSSLTKQENQAKKEAAKQLKQQELLAEQLLSIRRKNQQDEVNLVTKHHPVNQIT